MRRKIVSGLSNQANFLVLLALLLFTPSVLHAQAAGTGSIQGTATDPTNAVISGASVTLTNDATLVQRRAVTDDSGLYTFPNVPIGTYKIEIRVNDNVSKQTINPSALFAVE